MKPVLGIVDYGIAGNIHSIVKAVKQVGAIPKVIQNDSDFTGIDKLILPGVGSFKEAMQSLQKKQFDEKIRELVLEQKMPVLGICLGMQLLAKLGYEQGESQGLRLIDAEVREIKVNDILPHMGFNNIAIRKFSKLFTDIADGESFYFMHSFEVCNYTDVLALTSYQDHTFVSAVEADNVYGVQFHPEKSRKAGLTIFHNFVHLI